MFKKRYIITILLMVFSHLIWGQKNINTSKEIKAPKGFQRTTVESIDRIGRWPHSDKSRRYGENIYQLNNIVLYYNYSEFKYPNYDPVDAIIIMIPNRIKRLQPEAVIGYSAVRIVNKKKYAVTSYRLGDNYRLFFSSEINKDSMRLAGTMEYGTKDSSRVYTILDEFLQNYSKK